MNLSLFPSAFAISKDLIRQFGHHYADYRLYPQIGYFDEAFDAHAYIRRLNYQKKRYFRKSLSLYVHIPFCSSVCFYCQLDRIITEKNNDDVEKYLRYLIHEIELQAQLFENDFRVEQIYFGGAANFLSNTQLSAIIDAIQQNFNAINEKELYLEIDARLVAQPSILQLKEIGFNGAIIGVQALDRSAQRSIRRSQSEDSPFSVIRDAHQAGFKTIRVELTYGLPNQTLEQFIFILHSIILTNPHQIRLLNYLHLPDQLKLQQEINRENWPDEETGFEMLITAITYLTEAGYAHIGMNFFALPHDQIVIAQRQGRLYYGLQGYSIHPDCARVAVGISAVGSIGPTLHQNFCDLDAYCGRLEHHTLPIMRGLELNADDLIRRSVMKALICHSVLSYESVETSFPIEFKQYFTSELADLKVYEQAGLIALEDDEMTVTPSGQLLVGNICRVFDRYLRTHKQSQDYSVHS